MKSQFNADKSALTRREFMRLSALTAGGLLAARCSPAATPTSAAPIAAATESVVSDGITRGGRFVLGTPQPIHATGRSDAGRTLHAAAQLGIAGYSAVSGEQLCAHALGRPSARERQQRQPRATLATFR